MRKRSRLFFLACSLLLCVCVLGGCDIDDAELTTQQIKNLADGAAPYVPTTHTYIPAAVSALSTAALAVIRILKERRNTNLMKEAIKAKARQINLIITPSDNPGHDKESPVKTLMRKLTNASTPKVQDNLITFDKVRKGYM